MNPQTFLEEARGRDVYIRADNLGLVLWSPAPDIPTDISDYCREHRAELLAVLEQEADVPECQPPRIRIVPLASEGLISTDVTGSF